MTLINYLSGWRLFTTHCNKALWKLVICSFCRFVRETEVLQKLWSGKTYVVKLSKTASAAIQTPFVLVFLLEDLAVQKWDSYMSTQNSKPMFSSYDKEYIQIAIKNKPLWEGRCGSSGCTLAGAWLLHHQPVHLTQEGQLWTQRMALHAIVQLVYITHLVFIITCN